MFFRP